MHTIIFVDFIFIFTFINRATIHPKFMFLFQENKDIVKAGKCTKSLFNAILEAEENPMIFEQLLSRNSVTPGDNSLPILKIN